MTGEPSDRHALEKDTRTDLERRYFIGIAGGIGAAMLAGCSTRGDTGDASDDTEGRNDTGDAGDDDAANAGTFRLLISDQPVAIDEFDSLDVTFDHARIFREAESGDEEQDEDGTESGDEEQDEDGTESGDEEQDEKAEEEKEQRGFFTIDLEGSTVDLTRVVGDKAVSIFEGELSEGRYSKIELHAADVDGTVDGGSVAVKIPSEKLQIVKPFEVEAGGTLSFVFDINVVKKGQTGEYNLLPVISESGVDGEDVDVEEIEEGGEGDESETEDGESTGAAQGDGPPEDDPDGS